MARKKRKSPERMIREYIAENVEELMEDPEIKQMVKEMKQRGFSQKQIIELIARSFLRAFLDKLWPDRN